MRDSRLGKFLENRKFRRHNRVVLRCEYRIHTLCHQCVRRRAHLRDRRPGLLHIGNSVGVTVCLCILDRSQRRRLALVVKQPHLRRIRVCGPHQIEYHRRVNRVGSSRDVCARRIVGRHKSRPHRVGNRGEHDRYPALFRHALHHHRRGRRNRNNNIHFVRRKFRRNLP